ncbi:hypothetical protein KI387_004232, partial [Taxus chinensis]
VFIEREGKVEGEGKMEGEWLSYGKETWQFATEEGIMTEEFDNERSNPVEIFGKIARVLGDLRDFKFGQVKRSSFGGAGEAPTALDSVALVLEHFLCPISSEIMRDTIMLATSQ